jgi:argininosuccinate lyase
MRGRGRATRQTRTSAHKMWGGRFASGPHPALEAVNRSIDVDFRLWPFDIRLSQAWATALVGARVFSPAEAARVRRGLTRVGKRIAAGERPIHGDEDIHTMIDRLLHDEVGDVASRLHTGRSRNDQVATASRLFVIDALSATEREVVGLQRTCVVRAAALADAVMPAYTHLQRAQPVSAAHWMLAHFWALERDRTRIRIARVAAGVMPLGSGAIAGSAFRVNRKRLAKELGFAAISANSIDAVGDRDFMVDALFALTTLTTHLSRLAEDLILFGSSEFGFVRFGDAFSTGSSMMPQKRNPDALELARSSPARVGGDLFTLLGMLKGTPSGYNKDFQEDKRAAFDAFDGVQALLPAVSGTIRTLRFDRQRMRTAVSSFMMATDLADFLVRRGLSFREAHHAVGALVRQAEAAGVELDALPQSAFTDANPLLTPSARRELDPLRSLANREIPGGTGPLAVADQIRAANVALKAR